MEENEHILTPEQIKEIEAQKNQELYGDHVQKIGGCAVVTVDDVVVSLEIPITYEQLVAAIVKKKYDNDKVEAVTANFIAAQTLSTKKDARATEHESEYNAYQEWRNKAKTIAKEVIGIEK